MRTRHSLVLLLSALCFLSPLKAQTFVFAGDSITDGGWGASGGRNTPAAKRNLTDPNHIYGHSYMMLVASDWQSAYPSVGMEFHNRGISGDSLAGLAARWDADIISLRPDVLSVLVGVNDSAQTEDITAWKAEFRALLAHTRQVLPDCKLVLCTPFLAPVGTMRTREDYPERAARLFSFTQGTSSFRTWVRLYGGEVQQNLTLDRYFFFFFSENLLGFFLFHVSL